MTRTCKDCRWLADCLKDRVTIPEAPICTGFVPETTRPAAGFVPGGDE